MRIWTGRAGSGKTMAILKDISAKCDAYSGKQILLVPELNSHSMERRLAGATGNHGARTAEVLTFSRLADRVLAEAGGLAKQTLNPAGQLLTIQEAARRVQSGLTIWSGIADKPELLKEALKLIDECKTCAVPPEELFRAGEECEDAALAHKLSDLAQLLTAYERLCDESLPDPRDRLTYLRDNLEASGYLDDISVYLDGFLSFTPQELSVVERMLALNIQVDAAVTCDPEQPEIFVTGCKTVKTLSRIAKRLNHAVEHIPLGASKAVRPEALSLLEKEGLLPVKQPHPDANKGVILYTASSPFDECEHAAAYIRQKVRDEGARYRDFVVTARNIEPYTAFLEMAMSRYEVPIFVAEKPDLLSRPPFAMITNALDAVLTNFRYDELFACFKTGLTHMKRDEADKLENYVLTWNIRGGAWETEWKDHPDGYGNKFRDIPSENSGKQGTANKDQARTYLEELNELRKKAIAPFSALRESLKGERSASDCVRALYDFLCAVETPKRIKDRAIAHKEAGRLQLADEYGQLWEILVSAMEQFAWVCGDMPMTADRFAHLFRLVLNEYDVGTIPVSLDRVTCGDIERACSENAKYLILMGVNDGLIPKAPAPMPLLNDLDRDKLDSLGIELKAWGAERMLMEQETLYRALSCPTKELLLSWHEHNASGAEARPSYFIGVVKRLLPNVPSLSHTTQTLRDRLQAERPAIELACAWYSNDRSPAVCAAHDFYTDNPYVQAAANQHQGRGPIDDKGIIEALYGKSLGLNASRVDKFYSCRFGFFIQYGLKAKPRQAAKFSAMEIGTFLHYVLENALKELGSDAAKADKDTAKRVCRSAVNKYISENFGELENKTARFRYLFNRLVRTAEQILNNLLEELRESDFVPVDYEVDFSDKGNDMPPVKCSDGETEVTLSGKVDRVDGYIKDGRLYLRVMDYKSGKKSFSLSDIWYGLNMQLIIYLYALQNEGLERYKNKLTKELNEIVPAGVLYVPVRDELTDTSRDVSEEKLQALRDKALRRSGLLSDDMELLKAMEHGLSKEGRFIPVSLKVEKGKNEPRPTEKSAVASLESFGKLARYTHKKLIEMGQLLNEGRIEANPCNINHDDLYCKYCSFRAACRFDETTGDKARYLQKLSDQDFWKKLGGEG